MADGQRASPPARGGRHLQRAAGVRRCDDVGLRGLDMRRLPIAKVARRVRLDEVVDPGAAAADRLFRGLGEFEAGDRAQQLARLGLHLLGVEQVARVLEGDTELEAASLYNKLRYVILPLFYSRPEAYAGVMCSAIALNGSYFNSHRMMQQYATNAYRLNL